MRLAFPYEGGQFVDEWDHLARAFGVSEVIAIGCPEGEAGWWTACGDWSDISGRRVFLTQSAETRLQDVTLLDTDTLCFGTNDGSNVFPVGAGDLLLYIPAQQNIPLWSYQAAGIALWEYWRWL